MHLRRSSIPSPTMTFRWKTFIWILLPFCWRTVLSQTHLALNAPQNSIPSFDPNANMDNFMISEDTSVGSVIYTLKAMDADANDVLTFGVSGEGADIVEIANDKSKPREAKVRLIRKLDRETQASHLIRLTLTDGIISRPIIQDSTIYVGDENDEKPQFTDFNTTYYIPENAPPNTVIGYLSARDKDQGEYGMIRFDELDNKRMFRVETVNPNNGTARIVLTGQLDFETQPMYQLRIIAIDGNPSMLRQNTATLAVVVQVVDVQDTPPKFISYPSVQFVPENTPIGKGIFNVIAQDSDRGDPHPIQYSLQPDDSPFAIDPQSGAVYVAKALDRESAVLSQTGGTFVLNVLAAEVPASPGTTASVQVTVIIEDVNDNPPQFFNGPKPADSFVMQVSENSPVGSLVAVQSGVVPRVFDADQGSNGTFNLMILGAGQNVFDITPKSVINEALFMIRVKNSSFLDFEVTKQFQLTIVARESSTAEKYSSTANVIVNVEDLNDNIPVFNPDYYEVHMKENSSGGTHVLRVQAFDSDSGDFGAVLYTNLQGKYAEYFALDNATGDVKIKSNGAVFDREQFAEVFLTVEARDNRGRGNRATAQIRIILDDINDSPPVFDVDNYEATLLEGQLGFLRPLVVRATDRDEPGTPNSKINYALVRAPFSDHFAINGNGEISLLKPLDYEEIAASFNESSAVINLQVAAYDSGEPPLSSTAHVKIWLQDVNDNSPVFERQVYNGIVSEESNPGTVVATVSATDADRSNLYGRVTYRIERGAQDKFVIDAQSGVITVAPGANLDRDAQSAYELLVVALDGGFGQDQRTGSIQVLIKVTDTNNKPPEFPLIPLIEISEDAAIGSVVAKISALDPDESAKLVYIIRDVFDAFTESLVPVRNEDFNYSGCFSMQPDGTLVVAAPLDREIFETVKLTVEARDMASESGTQSATTTLRIRVLDANDNRPYFVFPPGSSKLFFESSVVENFLPSSPVFTIVAADRDKGQRISFSFVEVPLIEPLFKINPETGEIWLLKPLDHEQNEWINFTVRATDSGTPPLSSDVPVYLYVIDVNDNNPNFTSVPTQISIREDVTIGQELTTVRATDPDSGPYGHVSFILDPASAFGKFVIDKETGRVTVSGRLDREERDSYSLVVSAIDDFQNGFNRESRKTSRTIHVTIEDINDNAPIIKWDDLDGCLNLIETDALNTQFFTVRATDADQPGSPNSQMRFQVAGGNGSELFGISPTTGAMFTKMALTNKYGNFSVVVEARDLGFPALSTNKTIPICVNDFNDNSPVFLSANESLSVWENATIGSRVGQIRATDADIGDNGRVRFKFVTDQDPDYLTFSLDETTGWISLQKTLDRERQKQYQVLIEAYDLGTPKRSTVQRFTIRVKDINDNEPVFRVSRQEFHVSESSTPQTLIGKVAEAIDEDDDLENTQTCYFIVEGNQGDAFSLDKSSKELRLSSTVDREEVAVYNLTIKASSNCNNQQTVPTNQPAPLSAKDRSLLAVFVLIDDVNDNPPRFLHSEYTAGVTVDSKFGTRVTKLTALDADAGENAVVEYFIPEPINLNLNKEEPFREQPFVIDKTTGEVFLNVKFTPDMKGYFDFTVAVVDKDGFNDTAKVSIYLLRADQRVQLTVLGKPEDVRRMEDALREALSNITGAKTNIDDVVVHIDENGNINERLSDVLMHFVENPGGHIMPVDAVIKLIDLSYDRLESVFKDFNIIEVQRAVQHEPSTNESTILKATLIGITLGLLLLLMVSVALFCAQRRRYTRKLRAATAMAFSSTESTAGLHPTEVPGTNLHSYEGSNPVWMNSYVEKWTKETDVASNSGSSLDDNVVPPPNSYEEQIRKATFFGEDAKPTKLVFEPVVGQTFGKSVNGTRKSDQKYNNIYETIEDKEGKFVAKLESTEL